MKRRVGMLLAVIILAVVVSRSQTPRLEYVKTIGVSWNPGEWGWMSLVAFSADGSEVASDGVKNPQDPSENLSFWSFPEGRLVRKVVVRARTLSPDWKYYASPQGVGIVGTGKPLITFASERFGISAFSSDSRYVAESSGQQIRVFTLPDGKQVRAFRRHGAFSLAISPDGTTLASGHWDAVALRNLITGTATGMLRGFGRYVVGLSFSNDGAYLAAGTDTGDV
jgi:WD40 repeat protein